MVRVSVSTLERALLVPSVAWFAVASTIAVFAISGHALFTGPGDMTLPEAAALRDHAEILKLIRAGADPNARGSVREGIPRRDVHELTPLEAAIGEHHPETVEFLLQHGARVDAGNLPRLLCFAVQEKQSEAINLLTGAVSSDRPPDCARVDLPWPD